MNKLYRSNSNKIISGVCGGIGEYINIDPNLIRILALIIFFKSPGTFIIFYIFASAIIPANPGVIDTDDFYSNTNTPVFLGIMFIILGVLLLSRMLFPQFNFNFLTSLRILIRRLTDFWPVLLIILGIYLIANQNNEQ